MTPFESIPPLERYKVADERSITLDEWNNIPIWHLHIVFCRAFGVPEMTIGAHNEHDIGLRYPHTIDEISSLAIKAGFVFSIHVNRDEFNNVLVTVNDPTFKELVTQVGCPISWTLMTALLRAKGKIVG